MKKNFLFVIALFSALFASNVAFSHDFYATAPSGQSLAYSIIDGNTVAVEKNYSTPVSGDLVIPSTVSYNNTTYTVISIKRYAFNGCSGLTSVTIPETIDTIEEQAFENCTNLTTINYNARNATLRIFVGWGNITTLNIGNNVQVIPAYACLYCRGLTSVNIGNSVTSIGDEAFEGCSGLTSVTIPNSVTSIGDEVFNLCSGLTSVNIGNSVTSIGRRAFLECSSLTSVTIPNSVTSIGDGAFASCGLTSVTIPNSVIAIGEDAFNNCSHMTSVNISNSVRTIGDYAFYNNSRLNSITIPSSVTSIGDGAFAECTGLRNIYFMPTTPPSIASNSFDRVLRDVSVTVPCASQQTYRNAAYYDYFTNFFCTSDGSSSGTSGGGNNGGDNTGADTTIVRHGDTVYVYITVHDTVCPSTNSIAPTTVSDIDIELVGRQIVVSGADGMPVSIYDIQGRPIETKHAAFGQAIRFDVPATGVYMVRVGNIKAQRVAVLR